MFMKRFTPKKSFFSITPRLFTACGFLALLAASTSAMDRLVPAAFPTIQAAVNAALPGDRILVAPGVYQENVVATNANLKFIGKNTVWDGTLTNGTAGVCLTATGDNLVVQGFIFRAGASSVAQVQITGTNARVARCSSRGPSARFLRVVGNGAVVDTCTLYSVNSTAIEIIGDGAVVRKVKARQCDDNVVRIQGNGTTVTGCNMALNEDSFSISIAGNDANVFLNTFVNCDGTISITGTNATVAKNKATHNGGTFLTLTGPEAFVENNRVVYCAGTFISVNGSNAVVVNNRASFCAGNFLTVLTGDNAVVEKNFGIVVGGFAVTGDNVTVRGNAVSDAPNDKNGITVSSRTLAGGGLVENNKVKEASQTGLLIACHNAWSGAIASPVPEPRGERALARFPATATG